MIKADLKVGYKHEWNSDKSESNQVTTTVTLADKISFTVPEGKTYKLDFTCEP